MKSYSTNLKFSVLFFVGIFASTMSVSAASVILPPHIIQDVLLLTSSNSNDTVLDNTILFGELESDKAYIKIIETDCHVSYLEASLASLLDK